MRCQRHLATQNLAQDGPFVCDFADRLYTVLCERSGAELEARLVELLGYHDMDLIAYLIRDAGAITKALRKQAAQLVAKGRDYEEREELHRRHAQAEHLEAVQQALERRSASNLPNVYTLDDGGGATTKDPYAGFAVDAQLVLPEGAEKITEKDYDEIVLPIKHHRIPDDEAALIKIKDLDPVSQRVFHAYRTLNRVQSIVFPIAALTNENMLVCAPTGAGKTDIALLTVLRMLSHYMHEGRVISREFKAIYIAPMKALAAEITEKFSSRLKVLGIRVRELTGDMQLTRAEIENTEMLVTTPEKWDVVTRKSSDEYNVRLLILDEVHLLHEERGAVLESLIARTQRQVETQQKPIRIVGLSATLPNYVDVAEFLAVNPKKGLFFFDSHFRPCPLEQHFVGIKGTGGKVKARTNQAAYDRVVQFLKEDHQVMVFVHSRKETVKSAQSLFELCAGDAEESLLFQLQEGAAGLDEAKVEFSKSRNSEMKELFQRGVGMHHAGMLRKDRNLVEKWFDKGIIRVLFCTATLAWGVNLPAYAVIIKGTDVYDSSKGKMSDLSILDVVQIFGRAGRPQYEDRGVATLITSNAKLTQYVTAITQSTPIESTFHQQLAEHLNAEISLGTVTTIEEASRWLSYTFLYVRMRRNPFHYGIDWKELRDDPLVLNHRRRMLTTAAAYLHKLQMIDFHEASGRMAPKNMGRTAANFYLRSDTIEWVNTTLAPEMTEADVLKLVCGAKEFEQIQVRQEEIPELTDLRRHFCECQVKQMDTSAGKTNILLQTYLSRGRVQEFSLISDMNYIAQNAARILRAFFEIALQRLWAFPARILLQFCQSVECLVWPFEHVLRLFGKANIPLNIIERLENNPTYHSAQSWVEDVRAMSVDDISALVGNKRVGPTIHECVWQFPVAYPNAEIMPVTGHVMKVAISLVFDWDWVRKGIHHAETFHLMLEDVHGAHVLHVETITVTYHHYRQGSLDLEWILPVPTDEALSLEKDEIIHLDQVVLRCVSDRWLGAETLVTLSLHDLTWPDASRTAHTDLLDLQALPITALKNPQYEAICRPRFTYFNPLQTQIFHTMYHTRESALIGAPTGSGKTMAAELALWASFRDRPNGKVVYIAPLKALVKERMKDWSRRLLGPLNKRMVELTGDVTPDVRTIEAADIIVTTPEKWDSVSRGWQRRSYVQDVDLVIFDEIHLLGTERGPVLEVIISRMRQISTVLSKDIRLVGLSTALANAIDVADWMHVTKRGLFNFRNSVRPVPLEIYIEGFPGRHYCPRMATMNKPVFAAIDKHSPDKSVLVFVSSRRQTRLTAQALISLLASSQQEAASGHHDPKRWLHMPEEDMTQLLSAVRDPHLKFALQFGIGLHHAGLVEEDRQIVEELYLNARIQILIATSTVAWGLNFPAHLVVVKGTEFYDARVGGYVDFPVTDVLQMMGRAGRPQFDKTGIAVVLVHESKKDFYKRFLHESFPVESSLLKVVAEHVNAEVVNGTITSRLSAMEFLTWTYMYRRLFYNPSYYGCPSVGGINAFLSRVIDTCVAELKRSGCITEAQNQIAPTPLGDIAAFYYVSHLTVRRFNTIMQAPMQTVTGGLLLLASAVEYELLPVRHDEDLENKALNSQVKVGLDAVLAPTRFFRPDEDLLQRTGWEHPATKCFLLLQCHLLGRTQFDVPDYVTDLRSVMDQIIRLVTALIEVAFEKKSLSCVDGTIRLLQSIKQGLWPTAEPFQLL
ncbi:hypothetical protein CXG81DRAFT_8703, partial [Caulochytrium protostelioides]